MRVRRTLPPQQLGREPINAPYGLAHRLEMIALSAICFVQIEQVMA